MILIYAVLLALCFMIVLVMNELHTPTRHKDESKTELPLETEEAKTATSSEAVKETDEGTEKDTEKDEDRAKETDQIQGESHEWTDSKQYTKGKTTYYHGKEWQEEIPEEPYRPPVVVVASDTHYFSPDLTDYGEAFQTMVERDDGKVVSYQPQLMDAFIEEMTKLKPSAVVLSGDLTLNGEKAGHEALAEKLHSLEQQGVDVVVIPGNHDINNNHAASYFGKEKTSAEKIDENEFYDIYKDFGYDEARSKDPYSLSYIYELDEKNWLMMLDTAQYQPVNLVGGRIKDETIVWMDEQLKEAEKSGISVLPIGHHNLLKQSILYPEDCTLENYKTAVQLLESYRIPLYISGHLHLQRTKTYKPEPGPSEKEFHISEVVADSFTIPPCQYGIVQWKDKGGYTYSTKEADVEAWALEQGVEDENLLNFKEYGSAFLAETISKQIYDKMSSLQDDQMKAMADLYGELNRAYCGGTAINRKEVMSSEAYGLWERFLPDSKMFEEIDQILRDTGNDHNIWDYSAADPLQDISQHDIMVK